MSFRGHRRSRSAAAAHPPAFDPLPPPPLRDVNAGHGVDAPPGPASAIPISCYLPILTCIVSSSDPGMRPVFQERWHPYPLNSSWRPGRGRGRGPRGPCALDLVFEEAPCLSGPFDLGGMGMRTLSALLLGVLLSGVPAAAWAAGP